MGGHSWLGNASASCGQLRSTNESDAPGHFFPLAPRRQVMFGQSGYSRAMSTNVRQVERRLRALEQRLEGAGGRMSASAGEAAERVGEALTPVLTSLADRFRGGANSMSHEAAELRNEAAKLGNDALRRLSNEGEHRPLVTLGVSVGFGILFGLTRPGPSGAGRGPRVCRPLPLRRAG